MNVENVIKEVNQTKEKLMVTIINNQEYLRSQNATLGIILGELTDQNITALHPIKSTVGDNNMHLNLQNISLSIITHIVEEISQQNCSYALKKSSSNLFEMHSLFGNFSDIANVLLGKVITAFPVENATDSCTAVTLQQSNIEETSTQCTNTTKNLDRILQTFDLSNSSTCNNQILITHLSSQISSLKENMEKYLLDLNVACNCTEMTCPGGVAPVPKTEFEYHGSDGSEFFLAFPKSYKDAVFPSIFLTTLDQSAGVSLIYTLNNNEETQNKIVRQTERQDVTVPPALISSEVKEVQKNVIFARADTGAISLYGWVGGDRGDGFLVLPSNVLGKKYVIVSYEPHPPFKSQILIVSSLVGTFVSIRLKSAGTVCSQNYEFTLNSKESYQLQCDFDLTGTEIISTQPIAVFSGAQCASIPAGEKECEQLTEQMPPVESWGKRFAVKAIVDDVVRILAAKPDTEVVVHKQGNINTTHVLRAMGDYLDQDVTNGSLISVSCAKTCLVTQFTKLQTNGERPTMTLVPAEDQFATEYSVATPFIDNVGNAAKHFMQVTIKAEWRSGLTINGTIKLDSGWTSVPGMEGYVMESHEVPLGTHVVEANGNMFGVIVYGFGTSQYEKQSYGYPAGLRLKTPTS